MALVYGGLWRSSTYSISNTYFLLKNHVMNFNSAGLIRYTVVFKRKYKANSDALVIVMTLGGDPGPTRVICQRACDAPEAICHFAFSRGWKICHYSARGDFGPLPSEAPSLV